jgi:hypothetical protein
VVVVLVVLAVVLVVVLVVEVSSFVLLCWGLFRCLQCDVYRFGT